MVLFNSNLPPLDFFLLADRLAELYEMVFPGHPEWLNEEVVDWEDEEDAVAAVERFLGRVSTLLFPVYDDIWDVDLETMAWRLYEIPLIPMGYDTWHDDWLDLKEPVPYLLHMRYSRHDENSLYRRGEFENLYPDHQVPHYLEPHRLVKDLRVMDLPEPLDALPDLMSMLNHSTGNWWLDVGELSLAEGGGYPPWDEEDVEFLAEEWQQAKPVLGRIHRLLDWQEDAEEEIDFKLEAVRYALLAAYHQSQENTEQPEREVAL